jgi:hypothetical protein
MRRDSPGPEWYIAPDPPDDDGEPEPDWPAEALHVLGDCIVWRCGHDDDDD